MNEKQMNPVVNKTQTAGSKSWMVGGALAVAAALAMTFALRNAPAEPAAETVSRPQLVAEAGVESVSRYITLHSSDVAGVAAMDPAVESVTRYIVLHSGDVEGVQAIDPSVDSVARYIAAHTARGQSVPEAAAQGIYGFLRAHGATINP